MFPFAYLSVVGVGASFPVILWNSISVVYIFRVSSLDNLSVVANIDSVSYEVSWFIHVNGLLNTQKDIYRCQRLK